MSVTLTAAKAPSWFPLVEDSPLPITARVCLDCGAVEWDADPEALLELRNQALKFNMPV